MVSRCFLLFMSLHWSICQGLWGSCITATPCRPSCSASRPRVALQAENSRWNVMVVAAFDVMRWSSLFPLHQRVLSFHRAIFPSFNLFPSSFQIAEKKQHFSLGYVPLHRSSHNPLQSYFSYIYINPTKLDGTYNIYIFLNVYFLNVWIHRYRFKYT